jgi:hypothetical protein
VNSCAQVFVYPYKFESLPGCGYAVDNRLAPGAPAGISANAALLAATDAIASLRLHFSELSVLRRAVSFQITILKVLAGHPGGRASLADLNRAVAILMSSGSGWTNRTKRLAARAPDLDIFSQSLILRNVDGWQITDAGRALLASIEAPLPTNAEIEPALPAAVVSLVPIQSSPPTRPIGAANSRRPRRRSATDRGRRSVA